MSRLIFIALFGFGMILHLSAQNQTPRREIYAVDKLKQDFKLLSVQLEEKYPQLQQEVNCVVVFAGPNSVSYIEFPKTGICLKLPLPEESTIEKDQYRKMDYMEVPTPYEQSQLKDSNKRYVRGLIRY